MFEQKRKSSKDVSGKISRISEGTIIRGEIVSDGDVRLDGELIGNFNSNRKLIIGSGGKLNGDLVCLSADIEGCFDGKIKVSESLTIKANAYVRGEISCGKIAVEIGATLNVNSLMQHNQENQK